MRDVRSTVAVLAVVLLAGGPSAASAEGWGEPGSSRLASPLGEYLLLGGGVTDFSKKSVKDQFDVGGTWGARLGLGSRSYVGAEVAYVGLAASATGAGADLLANGAEGVLRLQVPYTTGSWLVEPFAFGGIGWSHVSLRDAPAGLKDSDDVGVVPFGGGLTVGKGGWLLDARFTYRTNFSEDLVLRAGEAPATLDRWAVSAAIGYEF